MALLQKAYLGSTPLFTEKDWWEDESRLVLDTGSATATASATVNTKGSWVQLIASTSANSSLLSIDLSQISVSNTGTATLLDIGTGASGSETVLLSNIAAGSARSFITASSNNRLNFSVPVKIASGTRIAARIQGERASQTAVIDVATVDAGDYATAPTAVDTYGGDTATSKGASFTGTSWTQVTASTSQAYRAIVAVPSMATGGAKNNATSYVFDIGVGASGSEVAFGKVRCLGSNVECVEVLLPYATMFARNIPSGSRLAIRSSTSQDISMMGMTLIGIP
jgi:hypothetical protein